MQNTLKQTHLSHIFGKEREEARTWEDLGSQHSAALRAATTAGSKDLAACWPLASCSPRHGLMMAPSKLLFGKNFIFSANIIKTRKSSLVHGV